MRVRSTVNRALTPVIGASRVRAVARTEREWRRRLARRIAPGSPPGPKGRGADDTGAGSRGPARAAVPAGVFPKPTMTRHALLTGLHELLRPTTYAEIGVNEGRSLGLARCRSIGVDPAFDVRVELHCDLQLVKATSDDFFARPDAFAHFGGDPVALAFIDGMHLAEYAYRDVANMEKHMSPAGVIVLDDMLPRTVEEAARDRVTAAWAGDVYKVAALLRELRPDLVVLPVNTAPTGTVVVVGLDPASDRLHEAYDSVHGRLAAPDPQQVPREILDRTGALDPVELLADPVWEQLRQLRERGATREEVAAAVSRIGGRSDRG